MKSTEFSTTSKAATEARRTDTTNVPDASSVFARSWGTVRGAIAPLLMIAATAGAPEVSRQQQGPQKDKNAKPVQVDAGNQSGERSTGWLIDKNNADTAFAKLKQLTRPLDKDQQFLRIEQPAQEAMRYYASALRNGAKDPSMTDLARQEMKHNLVEVLEYYQEFYFHARSGFNPEEYLQRIEQQFDLIHAVRKLVPEAELEETKRLILEAAARKKEDRPKGTQLDFLTLLAMVNEFQGGVVQEKGLIWRKNAEKKDPKNEAVTRKKLMKEAMELDREAHEILHPFCNTGPLFDAMYALGIRR